jgi:hypothetical protein
MLSLLTIAKSLFGNALAFIMKHWRVFLVLLIVGVAWYKYNQVCNERDTAVTTLSNVIAAYEQEVIRVKAQNAADKMKAKIYISLGEERHKQDLEKHKLNAAVAAKDLKDLYEKRIDGTYFNWSERVRLEREAASGSAGMSEAGTDPGPLAEALSVCDAAFTTLERACKVTTADYNLLRTWADAACNQVGCEEGKTNGN